MTILLRAALENSNIEYQNPKQTPISNAPMIETTRPCGNLVSDIPIVDFGAHFRI
jgi:hypothetical protein